MPKAVWNGQVIADSDETIVVEGNHYFPVNHVNQEFLEQSDSHTRCYWKGVASYYDVVVDGERARDGAFYYPDPSQAAKDIKDKDRIAFWRGVRVEA